MIFGRKATADPDTAAPDVSAQPTAAPRGYTAPKDKPTPKRSASEAARKTRVSAPADRKSAAKEQREQRRIEGLKVREAMSTGDDRYLPARDKGPVRKAVRTFVDSRLMFAELLMPIMVVMVLALLLGVPGVQQFVTLAWVVMITLVMVDLLLLWWRLRRMLIRDFPSGNVKGATTYGLLRATQLRVMRMPKPQVKIGGAPKDVKPR